MLQYSWGPPLTIFPNTEEIINSQLGPWYCVELLKIENVKQTKFINYFK